MLDKVEQKVDSQKQEHLEKHRNSKDLNELNSEKLKDLKEKIDKIS